MRRNTMPLITRELTRDEQAGQLVWLDRPGNLRVTEGIFWLNSTPVPMVLWKHKKTASAELFCSLDDVCRFKPRA